MTTTSTVTAQRLPRTLSRLLPALHLARLATIIDLHHTEPVRAARRR